MFPDSPAIARFTVPAMPDCTVLANVLPVIVAPAEPPSSTWATPETALRMTLPSTVTSAELRMRIALPPATLALSIPKPRTITPVAATVTVAVAPAPRSVVASLPAADTRVSSSLSRTIAPE